MCVCVCAPDANALERNLMPGGCHPHTRGRVGRYRFGTTQNQPYKKTHTHTSSRVGGSLLPVLGLSLSVGGAQSVCAAWICAPYTHMMALANVLECVRHGSCGSALQRSSSSLTAALTDGARSMRRSASPYSLCVAVCVDLVRGVDVPPPCLVDAIECLRLCFRLEGWWGKRERERRFWSTRPNLPCSTRNNQPL